MKKKYKSLVTAKYSVIVDYGGDDSNSTLFNDKKDAEQYLIDFAQEYIDDVQEKEDLEDETYKNLISAIKERNLEKISEILERNFHVFTYIL